MMLFPGTSKVKPGNVIEVVLRVFIFLREVECALSFTHCDAEFVEENFGRGVVWQLQVVHAGHDTGEIVIRGVWWFTWPTDHGKHWCETFEAYIADAMVSHTLRERSNREIGVGGVMRELFTYHRSGAWDFQ